MKKIKKLHDPLFYKTSSYETTPYVCIWCDLQFNSICKVEVHVRTYHKYNCNHCVKELKTWNQLLLHSEDCEYSKQDLLFFKNKR